MLKPSSSCPRYKILELSLTDIFLLSGTGKLGFSFVRITALHVSCNRLWLGTGNGVIISVPLQAPELTKSQSGNLIEDVIENSKPGAPVRVYADSGDRVVPGTFTPFCSMSQAQLSFHGHRDAVKFFVSVPGELRLEREREDNFTFTDYRTRRAGHVSRG